MTHTTGCPRCGSGDVMLEIGTGRIIGCGYCKFHIPKPPYRRTHNKVGRNDPCPCASGKKYKKCCIGEN
jgi:hypothetical protein